MYHGTKKAKPKKLVHDSCSMFCEQGFISIELLILIVVIGLLAVTGLAAYLSAKASARDKQRLEDVLAIQRVLQIYYTENGFYPRDKSAQMPQDIAEYLDRWPIAPAADGSCTAAANQYAYSQKTNGTDFTLTFCLGHKTNGLSAGNHVLNSKLVQ